MKLTIALALALFATRFGVTTPALASPATLPDTGISGVYEVMVGADAKAQESTNGPATAEALLKHFALFGFHETQRASISAKRAKALYGVPSGLTSIRLQNGAIDSHGLLRILLWEKPIGRGVGYAPSETVGQRLAVMMTADIVRVDDVFRDARAAAQPWLPITPIFADLYGQTAGKPDLQNRRVGVRESGVYGEWFNHVFFQRYGYTISGYGHINADAPLRGSEFTHHDFIIRGDINASTNYYQNVLGFRAESPSSLDGDWLEGPKRVFGMPDGSAHYYRGFVSPNNICGKLKFFRPRDIRADRSAEQRIGELGITLHSLYTPRLSALHSAARKAGLRPTAVQRNEFGELSFVFTGPDQTTWQILQLLQPPKHKPALTLKIEKTPQ
jgi:hypothetical protein